MQKTGEIIAISQPLYIQWFKKADYTLKTVDGHEIEVWEFNHKDDTAILSDWAKHFRQNYIDDSIIDECMEGTPYQNRRDFLLSEILPDEKSEANTRDNTKIKELQDAFGILIECLR